MELVENEIDTHVSVGVGSAELKRARPRKYSSVVFSKREKSKDNWLPPQWLPRLSQRRARQLSQRGLAFRAAGT